jgi:hypothetical protein
VPKQTWPRKCSNPPAFRNLAPVSFKMLPVSKGDVPAFGPCCRHLGIGGGTRRSCTTRLTGVLALLAFRSSKASAQRVKHARSAERSLNA